MADVNKDRFIERLNAIQQKNDPGKKVVRKVSKDGLVVEVVKPRRNKLVPVKSILTTGLILIMFKGFLFAQLGGAEYERRIDTLKKGHGGEVLAAFLLYADPATQTMARGINVVLRNNEPL